MRLRHRPGRTAAIAAALVLAMAAPAANAVTRTGTLSVTATVSSACNLTTSTLAFGTYSVGQATARDASGSIGYSGCFNAAMTFELGLGANASGSTRNMKGTGTTLLRYEIYSNSGRTTVFGTGTAGVAMATTNTGDGTVPVYGRIFASQVVPTGAYTDTVAVTLTF